VVADLHRNSSAWALGPVRGPLQTTNAPTAYLLHSMNFRDSALTRTQEHARNVIVLRCIPHEAVEVNHDAIQ
jgi:hypothetical protein